jgi:hypothetical protein
LLKYSPGNKNSISIEAITPWLILLIVLWTAVNTSFKKGYGEGKIEADAKGYYAYLPAVFIYHDLNFGFFDTIERHTYYNQNLEYDYLRKHNEKTINKYYAGTAVCLLPFFLAGHVITFLTGLPADGYSFYYTMMVHLGALFYLFLGLIGLRKLLRAYQTDEKVTAFVLFAIVFGTNLFYYSITEFAMSHLYSFTAITWFSYFTQKYFQHHSTKLILFIAPLIGLIVLIRPVNLLVIFAIPFLAGNNDNLLKGIRLLFSKSWIVISALTLFVLVIGIQLIIYKISTGNFIVYSYKEEGFNFLHPQFRNFMFSFRKGMFVYTPLLFLCLIGFIYIYRESRFRFFTLLAFLIILIYVFSSWHMWFYGGSFSQRVMIEYYAFFAILLSASIKLVSNLKIKQLYIGIIFLIILLCQVQTYQYRRMQIHWSDMNKEKYWNVFLRIDKL